MTRIEELMIEHQIGVWLDPDWWDGSGVPRWLAGQNVHAQEGRYYSTLTGSDPSSIEGDNVQSGNTPSEAVLAVVRHISGKGRA